MCNVPYGLGTYGSLRGMIGFESERVWQGLGRLSGRDLSNEKGFRGILAHCCIGTISGYVVHLVLQACYLGVWMDSGVQGLVFPAKGLGVQGIQGVGFIMKS